MLFNRFGFGYIKFNIELVCESSKQTYLNACELWTMVLVWYRSGSLYNYPTTMSIAVFGLSIAILSSTYFRYLNVFIENSCAIIEEEEEEKNKFMKMHEERNWSTYSNNIHFQHCTLNPYYVMYSLHCTYYEEMNFPHWIIIIITNSTVKHFWFQCTHFVCSCTWKYCAHKRFVVSILIFVFGRKR